MIINLKDKDKEVTVEPLNVTENGTYTAPTGKAYSPVTVNVGEPFPPVIKRVTGNPIELTDAASAPLVKCVTEIQGSQDLHGYDKPWVGGAGKNKLDKDGYVYTDPKTNIAVNIGTLNVKSGVTYTISCVQDSALTEANRNTLMCNVNGGDIYENASSGYHKEAGLHTLTFTANSDQLATVRFWNHDCSPTITYSHFMVEIGSTATSYEPYSNICPITAYTEGEIEVRGEGNIWDEEWENGSYTNGQKTTDASKVRCKNPISCYPSTTYFFAAPSNANVQFLKENGTYISSAGVLGNTTFTTPSTARYIVFNMYNAYGNTYNSDISINSPATITGYKAYNGTTHTTTYPSAIYRGSEDVVNGKCRKIQVAKVFDGTETWVAEYDYNFYSPSGRGPGSNEASTIVCSHIVNQGIGGTSTDTAKMPSLFISPTGNVNVQRTDIEHTGAAMQAWCLAQYQNGTPFTVVYTINNPTDEDIAITNLPIRTLSGYNHIESSTGDMVVDYITDAYQNFVDTTESAIPNTRKGGSSKAMDIFMTLENPYSEPDKDSVEKEIKK